MTLISSVLLIWLAAALAPALRRWLGAASGWVLALAPLAAFGYFLTTIGGGIERQPLEWMPQLGVSADMRLDGLSRMMALLVSGIGCLIVLYASGYLGKDGAYGRFNCMLLLFMGSMLGLVLADGLILLFVFWELTSITSYLLIGYYHEDAVARKKALQALIVTGGGGLALLAGLVMTGFATGEWTLSGVLASGDLLRGHPWYGAILTLVLLGAFTKSAQFPFHFWLPNAMAGPTPVSAYLHSATMVKAGVFLLAALSPVLGGTTAWMVALCAAGGVTFLLGAGRGLLHTDLKPVLAFTTLGSLGLLVMLLGIGTPLAVKAAVMFLLGHALYKAALFMVVGSIDHETGTREAERLRGLRRAMPLTAAAGGLAALSSAGLPPFIGFIGKEYVFKTGDALALWGVVLLVVAFLGNAAMMALSLNAGVHPFFGKATGKTPKPPHEAPFSMWSGPLLLGVLGLMFGLLPGWFAAPLSVPAAGDILAAPVDLKPKLWHGFNLPLLLSAVTVVAGLSLYRARRKPWRLAADGRLPRLPSADAAYDAWLAGVLRFAGWQTRVLQSGHLRNYVLVIFGTVAVLVSWKLAVFPARDLADAIGPVPVYFVALLLIMVVSTCMVLATNSKATALVGFGIVGFGISLLFTFFGAPDLAITQIVVETLTIVLLFLILGRIPEMKRVSSRRTMLFDGAVALLVGGLTTALVIKADLLNAARSISEQFREWSYPLAKGRNVVNVILVDFRALDTYAEVIVLVIAALGVGILMGKQRRADS